MLVVPHILVVTHILGREASRNPETLLMATYILCLQAFAAVLIGRLRLSEDCSELSSHLPLQVVRFHEMATAAERNRGLVKLKPQWSERS